jgi:hypothetical protein
MPPEQLLHRYRFDFAYLRREQIVQRYRSYFEPCAIVDCSRLLSQTEVADRRQQDEAIQIARSYEAVGSAKVNPNNNVNDFESNLPPDHFFGAAQHGGSLSDRSSGLY